MIFILDEQFLVRMPLALVINCFRHDIATVCVFKMPQNPNHPFIHPYCMYIFMLTVYDLIQISFTFDVMHIHVVDYLTY